MVSKDFLTAAAWTALLEQPPCCVRGCRAWFPKGGTWNQLAPVLRDFGWTSFALGSNKHQSKHRGISLWTLGFHLQNWGISSTFRTRQQCWPDFENNQREVDVLTPKLELNMEGFQLDRVPGSGSDFVPNLEWWSCEVAGWSIFLGNRSATSNFNLTIGLGKSSSIFSGHPKASEARKIWGCTPWAWRSMYLGSMENSFCFFRKKKTERNIYFNGLSENLKGGSKHGRTPAVDLSKTWMASPFVWIKYHPRFVWYRRSLWERGSLQWRGHNPGGCIYIYIYIASSSALIITYHHLS